MKNSATERVAAWRAGVMLKQCHKRSGNIFGELPEKKINHRQD